MHGHATCYLETIMIPYEQRQVKVMVKDFLTSIINLGNFLNNNRFHRGVEILIYLR